MRRLRCSPHAPTQVCRASGLCAVPSDDLGPALAPWRLRQNDIVDVDDQSVVSAGGCPRASCALVCRCALSESSASSCAGAIFSQVTATEHIKGVDAETGLVSRRRSEKTLSSGPPNGQRSPLWLATLRRYLAFVAAGNFVWEILQLPGFADWRQGSWRWLAFIVAIGTVGDVLIAATCLVLGLTVLGDEDWPEESASYWRVAIAACAFGFVYTPTANGVMRWCFCTGLIPRLMPVMPGLGVGVFPLLQWILIPAVAFYCARKFPATWRATS